MQLVNAEFYDEEPEENSEDEFPKLCLFCDGSGEGIHDGKICFMCEGKGRFQP